MGCLDEKVAIVTGAGGALGSASVRAMLEEGAFVLATDRDEERLSTVTESAIASAGERVALHACDVTDEDDVARLVEQAVSLFGGLDVMFNNAGVVGLEHNKDLLQLDLATWDETMAVNLRGVMLGCKHAVPAMRERGGGSIINTSSSAAFAGDVRNNAYCVSKAGVVALTRNVAAAFGQDLIRCNAIAPGIHIADEVLAALPETEGQYTQESMARMRDHCMLPRLGRPEDIADAAVFLASDRSSYITAQTLMVNGGLMDSVPHFADTKRIGSVYRPAAGEPTNDE